MKKKILIGTGILVLVLGAFIAWHLSQTKKFSPVSKVSYTNNDMKIDIVYCKPYKKGRLIFGEKSEGALQPYGKYWRLGANESTTFDVNQDVLINGKELKAGKYQMYAIPGKDTWKIVFNSEWDRWGAMDADHGTDVLTVEVPADNNAPVEEQLVISIDKPDDAGLAEMLIHWDNTLVKVPVEPK